VEELESYKAWCLFHPYRFHQVHFSNTFGQERNEQATKAAAAPWLIGEMPWCRHVLPASLRNFTSNSQENEKKQFRRPGGPDQKKLA
jgi:hypothetical protein